MRQLILFLALACPLFLHADADCDQKTKLNLTTSGSALFAAGVTGLRVVVCSYVGVGDGVTDFKLLDGTGSVCGTGSADITGTYKNVLTVAEDDKRYRATAGADACVNLSAAVNMGLTIMWKYTR